jgi:2-dehydropantoate 2-reductase
MRVGVVGAGAMGSMFGAQFAEAGHDVTLVDVAEAHVDAINEAGLTVVRDGAERVVRPRAVVDPHGVPEVDVLVAFVKSYHTDAALERAAPLVGEGTIALSLQNGWGNGEPLAAALGEDRIVLGVTYVSAALLGPGRVAHTAMGSTVVGPYAASGAAAARLAGELLEGSGFPCEVDDRIATQIWRKLVVNASANPTGALTGLASEGLTGSDRMHALIDAIAGEVVLVARAEGHDVELEESIDKVHAVLRNAGTTKSSMLQDFEAGRRSEIDVITGAVLRAAERHYIDTPLNAAMYALVCGVEQAKGLR